MHRLTYLRQMYSTLCILFSFFFFFQNIRAEKSKCVKVHWELVYTAEHESVDYCTLFYWNRCHLLKYLTEKRCFTLSVFILSNIPGLPSVFIICGYRGKKWKHSPSLMEYNLSWGIVGLTCLGTCAMCLYGQPSLLCPRLSHCSGQHWCFLRIKALGFLTGRI